MDSDVLVAYFDNNSAEQFKNSDKTSLGHKDKTSAKANTIIVLVNKDAKYAFGLAKLKNAPDSKSPCIASSPLDAEIYSGEYAKYNKYRIYIDNVKFFANPITYDWIRNHLGAHSPKGMGNMWTNNMMSYRRPFHVGVDRTIVDKYIGLVNSWMNVIV
jgi:hypothetical protein